MTSVSRTAPSAARTPRRVLLVEDQPDGREMLRLILEMVGNQVEVAADGLEGLNKALAFRPEVGILDIGLPHLDGYQLARKIREALGEDVFLIALTGYGSAEDRRRALDAGFNIHLTKPADPTELTRLVGQGRAGEA